MVLLNAVNFWKGSKANEILILRFLEYKLWSGGGGVYGRGLQDEFYPEVWQDISYLIMA